MNHNLIIHKTRHFKDKINSTILTFKTFGIIIFGNLTDFSNQNDNLTIYAKLVL